MVRVLAVADEESPALGAARLRELAPDLVLAAGDLRWGYLEFVADATNAPLVFVPGNHDPEVARREHGLARLVGTGDPCPDPRPLGGRNADGDVVEVAGLRVAGLGGCVRYRPGPHQYTQAEYRRRARRLLRRARRHGPVDVLLSHAPPLGLGDRDDPAHQGVAAFHDLISALRPTWHLHGHVHPYGEQQPDRHEAGTTVRNVIPWSVLEVEPTGHGDRRAG